MAKGKPKPKRKVVRASKVRTEPVVGPTSAEPVPQLPFPVVAAGGSAGGLEAFLELFEAMPPDSGMAFVLIQHLPPQRESVMADLVSKKTKMRVQQVEDGMLVKPNEVYVIRPGYTLTLQRNRLRLGEPVEKPFHRRPVDDFFRSLAETQRERAICVILSGMGSNGTAGAHAVKAAGGMCIAQDPDSARFPSMPRSAIDAGLADLVLRPHEIPGYLLRYAEHPYVRGAASRGRTEYRDQSRALAEILHVLRGRNRHNFNGYKKPTLIRRIQRRMSLSQITSMQDYAQLLRQRPAEVSALADDLMIHVTGFFRDAATWQALQAKVIAPLIAERPESVPIRAWVSACSSGEEAYTLAMLLAEAAEVAEKHFEFKIFATDMAERSLGHARAGIYPGGIESELSLQRLERFFDRDDAVYRVKKEIRERIVFAPQNALQDPPFSRIDICTCRNLLIYLEPELQRRALALMHFSLRDGGALLLGASETVSGLEELFEPIDAKHRIFRRIGPTRYGSVNFPLPSAASAAPATGARGGSPPPAGIAQLANKALLDRYTPPAVVVDRQLHVLHFHGMIEGYVEKPAGPAAELLPLVRAPFRSAVRTALRKALAQHKFTRVQSDVVTAKMQKHLEVTVTPLDAGPIPAYFMVCFEERAEAAAPAAPAPGKAGEKRRRLTRELQNVRDELRITIEELQASNEEMKASNEETTSINEELQSTNEELETSKEELQSLNEELTTVNGQLQAKMEELEGTTNDLSSLLSSTNIAVLFLDMQFRIRRFTPAVKDLFDLIPSDIGRPLKDLAPKFSDSDLGAHAEDVLQKLVPLEKEITGENGQVYMRRILPYRTGDNHIEGVVITFIDISERKRAEESLRQSQERYRLILDGIKEYAIMSLDRQGRISIWTRGAERIFGYSSGEISGRDMALLFTREECEANVPKKILETARQAGSVSSDGWRMRKDGSHFWATGIVSALYDERGELYGFAKVTRDNTEKKRSEEAVRKAKEEAEAATEAKNHFLAAVAHELRTPPAAIHLQATLLEKEGVSPDRLKDGLALIKRSAEEQKKLIEDLVDTARITAGKLRLEMKTFELAAVGREAILLVEPAAKAKGMSVEHDVSAGVGRVRADPHRLLQVMVNLLENAVKFTPEGGYIHLKISRRGTNVEIKVTDTGMGIQEDFLPRIFDRFEQADPLGRHSSGLGLGLSITKELVTLHGGTISAYSAGLDQGATFVVVLPLPAVSEETAGGQPAPPE